MPKSSTAKTAPSAAEHLDAIVARVAGMSEEDLQELDRELDEALGEMHWVPNPGPQTECYYSPADQTLYGGEAGGGKTDILIGLATQEHTRSLILRRLNAEVDYLAERTEEILGHKDGYNGQKGRWTLKGADKDRVIQFGGCQHPGDERRYKGQPKDLIGIDEASEFHESMIDYVIGWIRSSDPTQRCRLVLATNPPDSVEGEWILRWFAPWVDPEHPMYPYPEGKLLYFKRKRSASSSAILEFEFFEEEPEPDMLQGKPVKALTRTFIRSGLKDNPDYDKSDYRNRLAMLPDYLRERYAEGLFALSGRDGENQLIPTEHILAAQARWKMAQGQPPQDSMMTAIGADIAQGGADRTVLAPRYDEFFTELQVAPGSETPDGPSAAALIITHQRDAAQVNIDLGGGYGSSCYSFLEANGTCSLYGFVPSGASNARTLDGKFTFYNRRTEAAFSFAYALMPDSGYNIALPPDPELRAELCALRFETRPGAKMILNEKKDVKKILGGRSPDKGDAVIISWFTGSNRMKEKGHKGFGAKAKNLQAMSIKNDRSGRVSRKRRSRRGGHQIMPSNSGQGEQG